MQQKKVGVIVGSLRKGAYTRMLARALTEVAPPALALTQIEIGDLPLYNPDLETQTPPPAWARFRNEVLASDAILFITPEYNRGMSGALKNAIDVGSRPWGKNAWNGKPAGVVSATPGALGGIAGNHQMRQVLLAVNVPTMAHPEMYLPAIGTAFDEQGQLVKTDLRQLLTTFMQAFATWVERNSGAR